MSNSATAGGTAYEAKCTWIDAYGTSRLISPTLYTSGLSSVHLSFRQMFDDYNAGFNDVNILLQYRFNGASWTTLWSHAGGVGSNIPAEVTELDIPVTGIVLEIAWTIDGYHYNFDYWYIDDVCISAPLLHDVQTVSIDDVPTIFTPGTIITPKATVKNTGSTSPETFNVTMTITGGYSSTVTGVSLNSGVQTQVTFANWTPPQDNYTLQVCTELAGDLNSTNDCKSKPVVVKPPEKMYCYVAYGGTSTLPVGPAYFWDNDPGNITSLATSTSAESILSGTWANGTWYGSEYWDATPAIGGGWWTINPVTGTMTKLADLGRSFTGITYDLTAKIMYGIDWTGTTNNLYTIVPATGAATLIGSIGAGELLINLATDGAGYLYSIGISTDHLFKIDPTTASITNVGACGIDMNFAQDMEYDHMGNTMYATAYTTTGSLYTGISTQGPAHSYKLPGRCGDHRFCSTLLRGQQPMDRK